MQQDKKWVKIQKNRVKYLIRLLSGGELSMAGVTNIQYVMLFKTFIVKFNIVERLWDTLVPVITYIVAAINTHQPLFRKLINIFWSINFKNTTALWYKDFNKSSSFLLSHSQFALLYVVGFLWDFHIGLLWICHWCGIYITFSHIMQSMKFVTWTLKSSYFNW